MNIGANTQQNISKSNLTTYKKNYTPGLQVCKAGLTFKNQLM